MKCSKFSVGIITGLALGILFAPRKGSETRENLKKSCKGCQDKLEDWFSDKNEEINELKLMLANAETDLTAEARKKLLKIINKVHKTKEFFEAEIE